MTDPTPTPAAHDWRQLCRACNCPTAPIVPPELIRALELAEAALTDIGETLPGSGALRPRISRALLTWREHATPPAPTREAAPVPPQGAEISDEELMEVFNQGFNGFLVHAWSDTKGGAYTAGLRAVWSRAQAARPAIQPVPQLPPEQEFALRLYQLLQRFDAELFYTNNDDGVHFSVDTSKPFSGFCGLSELRDQLIEAGLLPAADQQEGRDAAAREPQP